MAALKVFVPGKLRNPLNGSWGGWRKHAKLAQEWRDRTCQYVFVATRVRSDVDTLCRANQPKLVTFIAHVAGRWDDDALPGAIKPIRDALVDAAVIHSDAWNSGHVFRYAQTFDPKHRGVTITVEAL